MAAPRARRPPGLAYRHQVACVAIRLVCGWRDRRYDDGSAVGGRRRRDLGRRSSGHYLAGPTANAARRRSSWDAICGPRNLLNVLGRGQGPPALPGKGETPGGAEKLGHDNGEPAVEGNNAIIPGANLVRAAALAEHRQRRATDIPRRNAAAPRRRRRIEGSVCVHAPWQ